MEYSLLMEHAWTQLRYPYLFHNYRMIPLGPIRQSAEKIQFKRTCDNNVAGLAGWFQNPKSFDIHALAAKGDPFYRSSAHFYCSNGAAELPIEVRFFASAELIFSWFTVNPAMALSASKRETLDNISMLCNKLNATNGNMTFN